MSRLHPPLWLNQRAEQYIQRECCLVSLVLWWRALASTRAPGRRQTIQKRGEGKAEFEFSELNPENQTKNPWMPPKPPSPWAKVALVDEVTIETIMVRTEGFG